MYPFWKPSRFHRVPVAARWAACAVTALFAAGCGSPEPAPRQTPARRPATTQPARARPPAPRPDPALESDTALLRTHQVAPRETLLGLAQRYYGDRNQWRRIYVANRNRVTNPDDLPVGMKLIIPPP